MVSTGGGVEGGGVGGAEDGGGEGGGNERLEGTVPPNLELVIVILFFPL